MATQLRLNNEDLRERMRDREFLAGQEISSIDAEKRTVDIIFFTGIDIPRTDWWTGEKYVLRFDPAGGDFSLLNNGAPVLDNHSMWDGSTSQKGRVEKAWQDGKDSKATLRFSKRESVNELWADIQDKIITKFSMGVQILREEKINEGNQEIRLAKQWQPFELSIAPIPADFGTTTLAAQGGDSPRAPAQKGPEMDKVETTKTEQPIVAPAVDQEALKRAATAEERLRTQEIHKIVLTHKLDEKLEAEHIAAGTSLDEFRGVALRTIAKRGEDAGDTREPHVTLIHDEVDTRRDAMTLALLNRQFPDRFKLDEPAKDYVNLSMIDIAKDCLTAKGLRHRGLDRGQIINLALQSTSDYPYILASALGKSLRAGYEIADALSQWKRIAALRSAVDFKTQTELQIDMNTRLEKVGESGEFHYGAMTEGKETWALKTYGKIIGVTRQALINDDLGAFTRIPMQLGQEVAVLEATTVWGILTTNGNLTDGIALFYATTHLNLATVSAAITVDSLGAAIALMMKQTTPGGKTMNIMPRYLVVPAVKLGVARQYTSSAFTPSQSSVVNPWAGQLEPFAEARLDTASTTAWYLFADPAVAPVLIYCYLQGQQGPYTETRQGFEVDGVEIKIRHDFAAAAIDFRGAVKNSGA